MSPGYDFSNFCLQLKSDKLINTDWSLSLCRCYEVFLKIGAPISGTGRNFFIELY